MESLTGRRRGDALRQSLDEIFPESFLEALRSIGDSIGLDFASAVAPSGTAVVEEKIGQKKTRDAERSEK